LTVTPTDISPGSRKGFKASMAASSIARLILAVASTIGRVDSTFPARSLSTTTNS
jgi:hypothetical protein